jgi:hypothetical protein
MAKQAEDQTSDKKNYTNVIIGVCIVFTICVIIYIISMPVPTGLPPVGQVIDVADVIRMGSATTGGSVNTAPDEADNPGDQAGVNTSVPDPIPGPTYPVSVPLVLYKGESYTGDTSNLLPGMNIKIADIDDGCIKKFGNLSCWKFIYNSLKVNPGYIIDFHRNAAGSQSHLKINSMMVGNVKKLTADFIESYVPADVYKSSTANTASARLPYTYWPGALYISIAKA